MGDAISGVLSGGVVAAERRPLCDHTVPIHVGTTTVRLGVAPHVERGRPSPATGR